jgi:hypothetical protein
MMEAKFLQRPRTNLPGSYCVKKLQLGKFDTPPLIESTANLQPLTSSSLLRYFGGEAKSASQ